MPEKNITKVKCVRFSKAWLFVSTRRFGGDFSVLPFAALFDGTGSVSGRHRYKYNVSATIKKRENPAAVAKGFAEKMVMLDRDAPKAGPSVKAMLKQTPTSAIVAPRSFSSLTSVAIAIASCTFPSLSPPTTRLARKVRKSVAATHSATDRILPHIDQSRAVRRPYLSESRPMIGEAIAWRKEKREPKAPPRRTMS
jgi:hypothetical protein